MDWIGRAASEVLSRDLADAMDGPVVPSAAISRFNPTLGTRPAKVPGQSSERSAAILSGATRLISGSIEKSGGLISVRAIQEDTLTGHSLDPVEASGATALDALSNLARSISNKAAAYPTANGQAAQAYFEAIEAPAASAQSGFEDATRRDPKFGPAWVSLVAALEVRGDRAGAENALKKASSVSIGERDRANLNLEAANLQGDRALRLEALRKVADYNPGDTALQHAFAEQETAAGNDAAAAAVWKKIADGNPADAEAWNNLGYSRAYAGDLPGALSAMQRYVDLHPNEANPLDSRGDIYYLFRKFKEAAENYTMAASKQPDALNGGEPFKAAWAKYMAGDHAGADSTFAQFRADQEKRKNASVPLLRADWLYRTGRKSEAIQSIEKSMATSAEPVKSLLTSQLAVWYVMEGKREKAYRTITLSPLLREGQVFSAFFVARPSASVSEWKALADRALPQSANSALHDTVLAYALMLDKHPDAALPIWSKLMQQETGVDYFSRAVLTRLQGKPVERPLLPNPLQYNQFAAIIDVL